MSTPRDPDEQYADRLRDVLRAEGDQVVPGGDGLMRIRERVGERQARNRWLVPVGVAAAVALVAGGVAGGLALAGNDDDSAHVLPPAASSTPTVTPTPSQPAVSAKPITVPVYYLGDTGTALRLYREFHSTNAPASNPDKAVVAVDQMLHAKAADPDYNSLWPENTTVRGVTRAGTVATVDFSKDVNGPFQGGTEGGQLSIQQLVHTVTAADTTIKSVLISVEGKPVTSLFGVDVSKPQKRGVSYTVLGAVWILAPTQNAKVNSPVTFSGQATVFEATVSIEVRRGATVVKRTNTMATTGGPGRGDWKLTMILVPGTYEIRAFEASAKDGSVTNLDTKTFTVR
ncbi:MAG: hypothetical protein QOG53_3567 [Frankiales bacterium]|jgi:hypothetical protein|nr:hypothetical protein [Frankiales bacterium]